MRNFRALVSTIWEYPRQFAHIWEKIRWICRIILRPASNRHVTLTALYLLLRIHNTVITTCSSKKVQKISLRARGQISITGPWKTLQKKRLAAKEERHNWCNIRYTLIRNKKLTSWPTLYRERVSYMQEFIFLWRAPKKWAGCNTSIIKSSRKNGISLNIFAIIKRFQIYLKFVLSLKTYYTKNLMKNRMVCWTLQLLGPSWCIDWMVRFETWRSRI